MEFQLTTEQYHDLLSDYYLDFPSPPLGYAYAPSPEPEPPPPPPPRSAFVRYEGPDCANAVRVRVVGRESLHTRLVAFMRSMWASTARRRLESFNGREQVLIGSSGGPCFKHRMSERRRRERLSQGYADLLAFVEPGSKGDKKSIVDSTAASLRAVQARLQELLARNRELRAQPRATKIEFCVGNASNPTVSLADVMSCLKAMHVGVLAVESSYSADRRLSATIAVQAHVAKEGVEREVERVLLEAERKARGEEDLMMFAAANQWRL